MYKKMIYAIIAMLLVTISTGYDNVRAEEESTGEQTETTDGEINTSGTGVAPKDADEKFNPFVSGKVGKGGRGVQTGEATMPNHLGYQYTQIVDKVTFGIQITTLVLGLLLIVWVSLQTLVLSIRTVTDGGYNVNNTISKFIIGEIEPDKLGRRIIINIGIIVIGMLLVYGGLSTFIQMKVYEGLNSILSYVV